MRIQKPSLTLLVLATAALSLLPGSGRTQIPGAELIEGVVITGKISGRVEYLSGIRVIAGADTAVTDAHGEYCLRVAGSRTYSVTPARGGLVFSPPSVCVAVSDSDVSNVDFSVAPAAAPGMVLLPPGTFRMGNVERYPAAEVGEEPVHQVTITRAFLMSRTEITQALWEAVIGHNPSRSRGESRPVEAATWFDAVKFCNALSVREGLEPCYTMKLNDDVVCDFSRSGYRLPTEAEWEYACRCGGKDTLDQYICEHYRPEVTEDFWVQGVRTGYPYHPDTHIAMSPFSWSCRVGPTQPVATRFPPNAFGLYDMRGNVSEWCWDWHSETYYTAGAMTDPHGPATGTLRVCRGGNVYDMDSHCRSSKRMNHEPDLVNNTIGFRVARSMPPSGH